MNKKDKQNLSRRDFMAIAATTVLANQFAGSLHAVEDSSVRQATGVKVGERQATGVKVGEMTDTGAIIWVRHTENAERNSSGVDLSGRHKDDKPRKVTVPISQLEGACPGAPGRVRVRYSQNNDLSDAVETEWVEVTAKSDFAHSFHLEKLTPGTLYHYESQTASLDEKTVHDSIRGTFETAPAESTPCDFSFCVMTCQAYHDKDHKDGHNIYPSMLAQKPKFVVFTGDSVYYDSDEPQAVTPQLARYHWDRMFSMPRQRKLLRNVGSYWEKDDHDTLKNDSWPGATFGEMTFEQGEQIFLDQVPIGKSTYRTFRWGKDIQIWFTEGRDYRSSNSAPDGAGKTIWGKDQMEWFKRTVMQSTATWKILISPTPLVGPDRGSKGDNHANQEFQHEGDEIRAWIKSNVPDNFFVVCGDRHWQYHSVDPKTGAIEFSVGPASDAHASGSPGKNPNYHKFHRVKGGFLSVTQKRVAANSTIAFRLHDVNGAVVHEWSKARPFA